MVLSAVLLSGPTRFGLGVVLPRICVADSKAVIGDGKPSCVGDRAGAG